MLMWAAVCYEQTLQSVSDPSLESAEDHPLLFRVQELMIRDFSMETFQWRLFSERISHTMKLDTLTKFQVVFT